MEEQAMHPWVRTIAAGVLAAIALGGCSTTSVRAPAPITDRSETRASLPAPVPRSAVVSTPAPAPAPTSGGQYVVNRGDTLHSIALVHGQDYRDIARWNNLDDPNRLLIGQVLRVTPPVETGAAAVAAAPILPQGRAEVRPLDGAAAAPTTQGQTQDKPQPGVTDKAPVDKSADKMPEPRPASARAVEPVGTWAWPAVGKVIETFEDPRNKGIDIAGKEGDPVLAASDGTVVYSGSGLRGYGNLIILKHTDDFVSAYAHNSQILVKQGQAVKRGQRIADIGRTDADQPKLHFEIRQQGKPVDPLKFLPAR
jgi:lipoprotein NlpD